jgi:hypothetical protein
LLNGEWRGQREKIVVVIILPRLRASAQESLFDAFSEREEKIIEMIEIAFLARRYELLSFDFAFVLHFCSYDNRGLRQVKCARSIEAILQIRFHGAAMRAVNLRLALSLPRLDNHWPTRPALKRQWH